MILNRVQRAELLNTPICQMNERPAGSGICPQPLERRHRGALLPNSSIDTEWRFFGMSGPFALRLGNGLDWSRAAVRSALDSWFRTVPANISSHHFHPDRNAVREGNRCCCCRARFECWSAGSRSSSDAVFPRLAKVRPSSIIGLCKLDFLQACASAYRSSRNRQPGRPSSPMRECKPNRRNNPHG